MDQQPSRSSRLWSVLSWLTCTVAVLVAAAVGAFGLLVDERRQEYEQIFLDMTGKTPAVSARVDAIPDWVFLGVAPSVMAVAVFLQIRLRKKSVVVALHMVIVAAMVLAFVLWYGPVFGPLVQLIEALPE